MQANRTVDRHGSSSFGTPGARWRAVSRTARNAIVRCASIEGSTTHNGVAPVEGCAGERRPGAGCQPLTEPSVRPPRQKRCSTRMRIASGITDSSAPVVVSW